VVNEGRREEGREREEREKERGSDVFFVWI